jgi:hypothetical protein
MARYRKMPVVIEAFRLGIDHIPDWFMDKVTTNEIILHGTSSGFDHHDDTNADIKTLEGWHHANFGDFIIKGIAGEIYPCKPDIFKATYEAADTTADVVEVVRCGQCKHWKINPNNLFGGYCRYCEGASIDHYCSYGERKK